MACVIHTSSNSASQLPKPKHRIPPPPPRAAVGLHPGSADRVVPLRDEHRGRIYAAASAKRQIWKLSPEVCKLRNRLGSRVQRGVFFWCRFYKYEWYVPVAHPPPRQRNWTTNLYEADKNQIWDNVRNRATEPFSHRCNLLKHAKNLV